MTPREARKAGARLARTGGRDARLASRWCATNRLSARLTAEVLAGYREERRNNPMGLSGRPLTRR